MVQNGKFLLIHKDVLPDVFLKVVEAKALLKNDQVDSVAEAVKRVGISRSTFYKYNDYVFTLVDGFNGKKATISMILDHHSGILSKVLETIAANRGNILTISQSSPIENKANVTITLDISDMSSTFSVLSQEIENLNGVYKFTLEAIESTAEAF
jgi:chorismate mutase